MMTNADRQLAELAATQWAVFDYLQARKLGLNRRALNRRSDAGLIVRLHQGVYRFSAAPESWEQQAFAAVRFNGPDAALSCRAAARLWTVPGFGSVEVELSKPRGRSQRKPYDWVHGSTLLPANHVTVHRNVPVTTPARTVFDLAGKVHPKRAERALDNALSKGLCTVTQLDAVFNVLARRGRAGTALMRDLLEARGDGYLAPTSELEALGRAVLQEACLPEPLVERNLGDSEEWFGRVDLLFERERLVIELDSRRHHTSLLDRQADRARDNRFMAQGWRVLRYTWWDLVERPNEVVAEIRLALSRAAAA